MTLRKFSFALLLSLGFLLAVAPAEAACTPACTVGKQCHLVQGRERCMTPSEYAATREGTSGTGMGEGTSGTGVGGSSGGGQTLVNPLKVDSLEGLLDIFLEAVIRIGTIVLVLMLIWVGFLFVTARGNSEKVSTARTAFFWTIIGGLILLGAKGLSEVIQSTVNSL